MMLDIGPRGNIGGSKEWYDVHQLTLIISTQDGWVGEALVVFLDPDFVAVTFLVDMLQAIVRVLQVFFWLSVLITMLRTYRSN